MASSTRRSRRKPEPLPRRHPWLRRGLKLAGVGFAVLAAFLLWAGHKAASIDISQLNHVPERTLVYDFRGRELGVLHGENRVFIPLHEVAPVFIDALLAREDNRFREHGGVDWVGVVRAAFRNAREMGVVQGASTLTMQLARNRFGLSGRTFGRKVVEVMVARRLEARYSKDQILEAYLNVIYFGFGQYGVEQASRAYFEKPARDLNLPEAALLVGLVRSPNRFSPFRNPEGAFKEMGVVLDRMAETGRIARATADAARRAVPHLRPDQRRSLADNWTMDIVRRELDLILDRGNIIEGGLRVFTTLDADLQAAAESSLEQHLASFEDQKGYPFPTRAGFTRSLASLAPGQDPPEPQYLQGAVVVIDNHSGGVRAMVGGRDVRQSRYNRALQARRQVGSLFKPFVYAAAFEAGLSPGQSIDDGPLRPGEIKRAPRRWRPQNSDRTNRGMQPVAFGLVRSRNTMSVRVGDLAGLDRVRALADRAGIASDLPRYPSIYLGSVESSPRDMAAAFAVFPTLGVRPRPFLITEIQDREGRRVFATGATGTPGVIRRDACLHTSRILRQVVQPGGTAGSMVTYGVDFPCAGKTGTTDNYRDAWFAGYTSVLTGVVWVGFDDPDAGLAQGYGSRLALPVWARTMLAARKAGYVFSALP